DILLKRFHQEANLASRLEHPNIVRAIELGIDDDQHFFAMEFIDGDSVGGRLKKIKKFSEAEALRICLAAAEGLAAAHSQGLVHRDVKPDNIMITTTGEVKIADMGLAKDTIGDDLNLTKTGRGLGTPHFMAPEQFKSAKNADARCDVYSLGATLYMMVTGHLPFKAGNPLDAFIKKSQNEYAPPEQLRPDLGARTVKIIKACMEADPAKRPPEMKSTIKWLKSALEKIEGPLPDSDDPVWFVIYQEGDERKKIKGKQSHVAALLRQGRIGSDATGSTAKEGPFEPLSASSAFQDALAASQAAGASVRRAVANSEAANGAVDTLDAFNAATQAQIAAGPPGSGFIRPGGPPEEQMNWLWIGVAGGLALVAGCAFALFKLLG
ncbi:MAG TPA: serine/threonine-protein kinase, partial [Planctomycetia bacterium]|nr:serine/threonine-protein kinase [Planctomycetia bacterium]